MSLSRGFSAGTLSAKIVPFFRLESGLSLHCWPQRESCCFGGDFLQGSIGCLALACSVQQASPCCLYLRKWGKRLLQGYGAWLCPPAQPSTPCRVPAVRAGVRRKPVVWAQSPCASPGASALAGGAASLPVLSPGEAVDALGDGDT